MNTEILDTEDFIIKVPKHIWQQQESQHTGQEKKADFDILERTGVRLKLGERDSDYGKIQIQTFTIEGDSEKILSLLNTQTFYTDTSKVLQYIYEMGFDLDQEKRHFASVAVARLSDIFPLADLTDSILWRWAEGPYRANYTAALALTYMIQSNKHQSHIVNLLEYWSGKSKIRLVNTALMVYNEITQMYPKESLNAIGTILLNEKTLSSYTSTEVLFSSGTEEIHLKLSWETIRLRIFRVIEELYLTEFLAVIEALHNWFQDRKNPNVAIFAAIVFLFVLDIKDIAKDDVKCAKTVSYLYDLWENRTAPIHQQLQGLTTTTIHTWAETVLKMAMDDPDRVPCQQFFYNLYERCASARQNRLDFHLRRWQRQVQQRGQSTSSSQQLDFLSLIPDSKQS